MMPGAAGADRAPRLPFVCYMAVVLLLAAASLTWIYGRHLNGPPIRSDGMGYYMYLPAVFVFHDIGLTEAPRVMPPLMIEMAGMRAMPETGRQLLKYTMGAAVLQAPFFLAAHAWAHATGEQANGFTMPYQVANMVSALFWLTLGSWLVYGLLHGLYGTRIALFSLGLHTFGTALFHYATYDASFSHVYSFFLFALLLRLCSRDGGLRRAVACGLVVGMIFLVRVPNALAGLYCLLAAPTLGGMAARWRERPLRWAAMAGAFALCAAPQFVYWKYVSGQWMPNPYGAEWFTWSQPHVVELLFSIKKGLFTYYPLLALSAVGVAFMRRRAPRFFWPTVVFLPATTYVLASWWCWYYGGGLGQRVFVDYAAVFCLGLGALLDRARDARARAALMAAAKVCALACVLFMALYWRGFIPYDGPTWEQFTQALLTPVTSR